MKADKRAKGFGPSDNLEFDAQADRTEREQERSRGPRHKKPPREAYNIQFAQGLSGEELLNILQYEILRARDKKQPGSEVALPTALVHDIKFRLKWYLERHGDVQRPKPKRAGHRE
jgi:hypothetical protein